MVNLLNVTWMKSISEDYCSYNFKKIWSLSQAIILPHPGGVLWKIFWVLSKKIFWEKFALGGWMFCCGMAAPGRWKNGLRLWIFMIYTPPRSIVIQSPIPINASGRIAPKSAIIELAIFLPCLSFFILKINVRHQNIKPDKPMGLAIMNAVWTLISRNPVRIPTTKYMPGTRSHARMHVVKGFSFRMAISDFMFGWFCLFVQFVQRLEYI